MPSDDGSLSVSDRLCSIDSSLSTICEKLDGFTSRVHAGEMKVGEVSAKADLALDHAREAKAHAEKAKVVAWRAVAITAGGISLIGVIWKLVI